MNMQSQTPAIFKLSRGGKDDSPNLKPRCILLVDDDHNFLLIHKKIISSAGYHVLTSSSGNEALETLRNERPDVIFLDVDLSDTTGLDLCRTIKADPVIADTRVFFLSGTKTGPEDRAAGLRAGADGYLLKPAGREELLAQIESAIRIKQTEEALRASEERSRLLSEVTMEGIVIHKAGIVRDCNSSFTKMSGYGQDELMGNNFLELVVHEDDRGLVLENIDKEYAHPYGIKFMKKDGGVFFAEIEARNFGFRDEKLHVAAVRDITDRKKSEEALLQSYERLKTVLNSIEAFVCIVDMETYEVLFCNEYRREIWGDVVGMKCWETLQQDQSGPCSFCNNPKLLDSSGQSTGVHIREFYNSKTDRWYDCRDRAIQWIDGRMVRMEIAIDITKRKEAEANTASITKQLQAALAEKDILFSIIAHDLRSPMSGLVASTKLLANQPDIFSEKDFRFLSKELHNDAQNTLELLEDLLQWARMNQGGIDYAPSPSSLDELLNMGLTTAQDLAKSKDITLRLDIAPGLTVLVDQPMIKTVIRNILFNAIKFTPRGGEIAITTRHAEQKVTVAVQDNGIGMNEQVLSTIFSLHKEKRQLGTEGEEGTGLGLVLCKQFIEQHGGEIWVESSPGQGTTVFFTLPVSG